MRKRRAYQPSTGHKLVRLVTDKSGRRTFLHCNVKTAAIKIAGPDIAEWAMPQLLAIPDLVRRGWAGRRKKAVR